MTFKQNIKRLLRPLKSRLVAFSGEMTKSIDDTAKNALAYNVLRDLDIKNKDEVLVSFYPKIGSKITHTKNIATMQRFLELTCPIFVENLVRIGGANDGGYVMINPRINLTCDSDFTPPQF